MKKPTIFFLQAALFVAWPIIACLLLVGVAVVLAAAWVAIPFGRPTVEGNTWTLNFPWHRK